MAAPGTAVAASAPLAVLHVDDSPADRYRRRRALAAAGFRVTDVDTVAAARAAFAADGPDVVLLDVRLPDGSGFDLARELKAEAAARHRAVAVLLISSYFTESEYRVRGLESGADAYLVEPIEDAELVASVRSVGRRLEQVRVSRDIADQLQRRVEELENLLDLVPVGVAISEDAACRQMRANAALLRLLGVDHEVNVFVTAPGAERSPWRICRDGRELTDDELPLQRAAASGTAIENEECDLVFDDGRVKRLLVSAAPLFAAAGTPRGSLGVFLDITEQKALEEQRVRVIREKDEFLNVLSHELRQPLSAIFSALHVLRIAGSGPIGGTAEQMIERQAHHLKRMVDDLVDAARIARGKLALRCAPLDLREALADAIESARPQVAERGLSLDASLPDDPAPVQADLDRLVQVFANLLQNAVKYTEPGGAIRVAVERASAEWLVRVADSGQGIPPEFLPYVFELFVQERNRGGTGLGIGLAVVKRLVEMHGGRVEARSGGVGKGSEFRVWLPACDPAGTHAAGA